MNETRIQPLQTGAKYGHVTVVSNEKEPMHKVALIADEAATFAVVRPDGSFVCEINLFSYEDGRLILDVIDLKDQFMRKAVFTFNNGTRKYVGVDVGVATISVDLQK